MKKKLTDKLLALALIFLLPVSVVAQSDQEIYKKIDALVKRMTTAEKVAMIHASSSFTSGGVQRLGIPEWVMSDGPHGVRLEHGRDWNADKNVLDSGTYLPVGVCLAATWNPQLGYSYGSVLGSEAAFRGKDVILGPGINIIRTPLNGRNFEYQSEDPFLVSKMVVGYIKGVQDQGVAACVKHYALNNQEILRTSIDVQLSERALREIYLPGFKAAIHEGNAYTLMGSYNKVRGQWASENHYLMNQILKKEWGFKGAVISDWGAVHSTMQSMWNGLDVEMGTDLAMLPNPNYGKFYFGDTVLSLVKNKLLPEYFLDDKVRRILYVMMKTNVLDGKRRKGNYNTKEHQRIAARVAEEGIVLLKNENNTLPLSKSGIRTVAVIGYNAARLQSLGGGSSQVKAYYEVTPLQGIQNLLGTSVQVSYSQGYDIARGAKENWVLISEAVAAASKADVTIFVGGWTHGYDYAVWKDNAYDAEDADKPNMDLPFGQDILISELLKASPKTVVVMMGGGPLDMSRWISQARAVVQSWYAGMEGGNALAGILFGNINPSGKLPMTFPKKLSDVPAHKMGEYPGDSVKVYYKDDIYVGYRYYDTYDVEPEFAFGHGLSYTSFAFSNLVVKKTGKGATATFTVRNTGKKAGAEVAQLYVKQEAPLLPRPEKELKGFQKIFLQAGESKTITITLDEAAFQYYNDVQNKWVKDGGNYQLHIGSSSRDIRLKGTLKI